MSKDTRKYFPNYQINSNAGADLPEVTFRYGDVYFITKLPLLGATQTQRAAIEWAAWSKPPVMWVSHKKPITPDRDSFKDPTELCREYYPYAMAIATLQCLGEGTTRRVKVYFCKLHVSIHHPNKGWLYTTTGKDFFAVELDDQGNEIPFQRGRSEFKYSLPSISAGQ